MIETLKIATTMAEVDQDVTSAISVLKDLNINNIIYESSMDLHWFMRIIKDNELSVAGVEIDEFNYPFHRDLALALNPKSVSYTHLTLPTILRV